LLFHGIRGIAVSDSYGHSRVHAPNDRAPPSMVALTECADSNAPDAMKVKTPPVPLSSLQFNFKLTGRAIHLIIESGSSLPEMEEFL